MKYVVMPWVTLATQPTRAGRENDLKGSACGCCRWSQEIPAGEMKTFPPSLHCVGQGEGRTQLGKTLGLCLIAHMQAKSQTGA